MLNKLICDKGWLYGRVERNIYLAYFTIGETKNESIIKIVGTVIDIVYACVNYFLLISFFNMFY